MNCSLFYPFAVSYVEERNAEGDEEREPHLDHISRATLFRRSISRRGWETGNSGLKYGAAKDRRVPELRASPLCPHMDVEFVQYILWSMTRTRKG